MSTVNVWVDESLYTKRSLGGCTRCGVGFKERRLVCSACKGALYCSKHCQKKHWKFHKPNCEQTRALKKADPNKREHRLFRDWRQALQVERYLTWLVPRAFPNQELFLQQPSLYAVVIKVEFDYNYTTFVLTDPPCLVLRKDLTETDQEMCRSAYKGSLQLPEQHIVHSAIVTYRNRRAFVPALVGTQTYPCKVEWSVLQLNAKLRLGLQSSVFENWDVDRQRNVDVQLKTLLSSSAFSEFMYFALMSADTERKHALVISMETGHGLAEIKQLTSFRVMESERFVEGFIDAGMTPAEAKVFRETALTKPTAPGLYHLPTFVIDDVTNKYMTLQNFLCRKKMATRLLTLSPSQSLRTAQDFFVEVQAIQFPKLQSPPLD